MEFYPNTFDIKPETREVMTQIQGKKVSPETMINIRGVLCAKTGVVQELDCPKFTLERYGEGYKVQWDREMTQELSLILEAQGMGLIVQSELFFRDEAKEAARLAALNAPAASAPTEPVPEKELTPVQHYKSLIAMGVEPVDALKIINTKFGDDVEAKVKAEILKELSE